MDENTVINTDLEQAEPLQNETPEVNPAADGRVGDKSDSQTGSFTKEEMDMIIQRRLKEEEGKFNSLREKLENDYKEKEFKLMARDSLVQNELPAELIDFIPVQDKESLDKLMGIINEICYKKAQAEVMKRLAGKTPPAGNTKTFSEPQDKIKEAFSASQRKF